MWPLSSTRLLCHSLIAGCALFSAACAATPRNFVVDPLTVCRCEGEARPSCSNAADDWRFAVEKQLEVAVRDFARGAWIGTECESEGNYAWTNDWRPFDGYKHTLVGTLHRADWYYCDDKDWAMSVIPDDDARFTRLIDEVEAVHDLSGIEHQACGRRCLEVEISPDEALWSNPWFFTPGSHPDDTDGEGYSTLEGRRMGFYGPWIVDAHHFFKSEIHPAQMVWWTDRFGDPPVDVFWLMLLQDNTGRYVDRDNFDCGGILPADPPPGWKPWAEPPLSGEFRIAFEADPYGPIVFFSINEMFSRFVVTSVDPVASFDSDNAKTHALELNGKILVRVEENQQDDEDLGITFTGLCLRPDGKLRGFVSIKSKVGRKDGNDKEGYHVLYVMRSLKARPGVSPPDQIVDFHTVLLTTEDVDGTLRGDSGHFAGDLVVTLDRGASARPEDSVVSSVVLTANDVRKEIAFVQKRGSRQAVLRNVPLLPDARIVVTTASGLIASDSVQSLSLRPRIEEKVTHAEIDPEAWTFVPKVLGAVAAAPVGYERALEAVRELELTIHPHYEGFRGKERSDRLTPFPRLVNAAIERNDRKKLEELFHSAQPLAIAWTFEAANLTTGAAVPVQVDMQSRSFIDDTVRVRFPADASTGIIECLARGKITDAHGRTATVEHRFWSHALKTPTSRDATTLLEALTHIPVPPDGQQQELPRDATSRRSLVLNAHLARSARDGRMTIQESRTAIAVAMRLSTAADH